MFAACTKENTPVTDQTVTDHIVTINATIAGDTKIALGEVDEKKVNWTDGDKIKLTISGTEYEFTWEEGTTFAYEGNDLPTLEQGTVITATYASTYYITQTGLKADVGNYMALSAETTVKEGENYGDLNLTFSHGTSVLKLTLSNDAFKGAKVTDITVKAGAAVVATATETFTGDNENGSVTAYLAIQPAALENVTIHATCNGNTYTNTLGNNNIVAGKIYQVNKTLPYAYVDLGLPSGIKWASFNVGATSPEGYGDYFAWGETSAKNDFNNDTYAHFKGNYPNQITEYCNNNYYGYEGYTDTKTVLDSDDDAATANWGNYWRMPTSTEMKELLDNCTLTKATINNMSGYKVTSNSGKSIFLPAAGFKDSLGFYEINISGCYWASTLYTDDCFFADIMVCSSEDMGIYSSDRTWGLSVRPVYVGN